MDPINAMNQSDAITTGLIAGLTPENREMSTPCDQWTVHDLLGHVCGGAFMIAGGLQDQSPPEEAPDFLADGPAAGWAAASAALAAAATPEALEATHTMPFGEVPGAMALSVIVADQIVHAWDLAQATGQDLDVDDELAEWALATWQQVVPAEGRTGDGFRAVVEVSDGASPIDRLAAYTGRNP
ncbi:MAG: TIGR03086 family metal-binding protein [Acidimicrobiia bacterium]|nr:TIGR03086 family metal-binding protein [Acidimicrobiia bacterium]